MSTTASPATGTRRERVTHSLATHEFFLRFRDAFSRLTGLALRIEAASQSDEMTQPTTMTSAEGMVTTGVPVRVGRSLLAVLHTGDVSLRAYDSARYEAAVEMLKSFAFQLGECAHRLIFATTKADPQPVREAKAYILDHLSAPLSLEEVSHEVNVSPFHFCKIFKRSTGLTFTDFVNRARVEKARRMLMRPEVRITEVAYDAGFQSLSHFNRSFRRIASESPTEFRSRMRSHRGGALLAA